MTSSRKFNDQIEQFEFIKLVLQINWLIQVAACAYSCVHSRVKGDEKGLRIMQCPICQMTLQMTERQGVEIDYCPKCRGVWLDRGELQKIIDLSLAQANPTPSPAIPAPPAELAPRHYRDHEQVDRDHYRQDSHRHDTYRYDSYPSKPKKRESWLSELFDWD